MGPSLFDGEDGLTKGEPWMPFGTTAVPAGTAGDGATREVEPCIERLTVERRAKTESNLTIF